MNKIEKILNGLCICILVFFFIPSIAIKHYAKLGNEFARHMSFWSINLLLVLFILSTVYDWMIHKEIYINGLRGKGIVTSCEAHYGRRIIPRYYPVVTFYIYDKIYVLKLIGSFYEPPAKVDSEIEIIYFDKYPEKLITINANFKFIYIRRLVLFSIALIFDFVYKFVYL
ncbi:hypothetical protein [Hydrogenoanaerobacterium saccharovorans]|uniref:hypothetical protein n=1 Tax=Hydrogenoanaerobacterium saccharovorans TaxID=474960 RepID=UPI000B803631|nr:hypothetical protein [Hydrogenoanaerobacterium saccharovorans]